MLRRDITNTLKHRLADYPACALIGPRQCGKTTLAQSLNARYFDLERDSDRIRLDLEWPELISGRQLVVLDEAHVWPEAFPRMRSAIDSDRKRNGRFLILGSVSPELMTRVSQSLAGRLALVELTPLMYGELQNATQRARHWLHGGYPDGGILSPKAFPGWQQNYLALLARRDLPAWGLKAQPQVTERLAYMLAALHGQTWNASKVGQSLSLSYHTVNSYLDFLEGTFLIRRLHPFMANIRKRLVKSPKVFWRDSGLLHSILGAASREQLLKQPWVGASWEGYVVEQIIGTLAAAGRTTTPYYFRTSDQHELDLVLDAGGELWAFEIKLTTAPGPDDMARLNKVADMIKAKRRVLVTQTSQTAGSGDQISTNVGALLKTITRW